MPFDGSLDLLAEVSDLELVGVRCLAQQNREAPAKIEQVDVHARLEGLSLRARCDDGVSQEQVIDDLRRGLRFPKIEQTPDLMKLLQDSAGLRGFAPSFSLQRLD